jgi:probable F420-dependent oxidoreductase
VRLGVHLPQFREPVPGEVLSEVARIAEDAGADDLWVSDHLILPPDSRRPPASFHDPLTVLTWAAAATRRAGLGTSVLVAPYRHPLLVAKALASLDALSGGRVVLGVASGWHEGEFESLGVPFRERGARTDEAIRLCRALWSGAESFRGRWTRLEGVRLLPPPAQAGGPPVWVGGNSDAGLRRAARLGDGWHTTISDPERLGERIDVLRGLLDAEGRSAAGFVVSVRVRADVERMAELAPRLRALEVDHVLVDPPALDVGSLAADVAALRDLV